MAKKYGSRTKKFEDKPIEIQLLAKRIKHLRKEAGYTNYEYFAYDNEITRTQYGRYEQGEDLRFTNLVRLCKAFKISMSEFFSEGFEEINLK